MKLGMIKNPKELFKSGLIEKCSKIIISSVTETDDFFIELLKLKETILFTTQTQIPIINDYKSISTLGSDRLLASVGAYFLYPKSNVLVMGENRTNREAKYIHGTRGKGMFTFYGGHDPEDYTHRVGDPKTELDLHSKSPGYRLILNNVLFPAAKKKKQKT